MGPPSLDVLVDADACPVKDEVYRVAERHGARVKIVANAPILVPKADWIERVIVPASPDAADDWIAAHAHARTVVVTADIPLAARALQADAQAISPTGQPFTRDSIGMALAMRGLLGDLRAAGAANLGGPRPFGPRDRSRFLSALDRALVRLKRV